MRPQHPAPAQQHEVTPKDTVLQLSQQAWHSKGGNPELILGMKRNFSEQNATQ